MHPRNLSNKELANVIPATELEKVLQDRLASAGCELDDEIADRELAYEQWEDDILSLQRKVEVLQKEKFELKEELEKIADAEKGKAA